MTTIITNDNNMKKNLLVTICLVLVAISITTYAVLWHISHRAQQITIKSLDNTSYSIAYYSSENGQWLDGKPSLKKDAQYSAKLRNHNSMAAANYQIAVGNRLGKFTCTANIVQPALGKQAKFVAHQGNCRTEETSSGSLTLVIDSQSAIVSNAQRWH